MKIIKECKKRKHGLSLHGIYKDKKGYVIARCLECAKDYKKKRYQDSKKREHDKEYTTKWIGNNKAHCKRLTVKARIEKQLEKRKIVTEFLKKEKHNIINCIVVYDSPLSLDDIKKHCYHYNVNNISYLREFIIRNLESKMFNEEVWRQSSKIKYRRGVRDNWKEQPEHIKEQVRQEYRYEAHKIVKGKIRRALENER